MLFALVRAGRSLADDPDDRGAGSASTDDCRTTADAGRAGRRCPTARWTRCWPASRWPDAVAGCAVSQEIVVLPPSAEADLTDGTDVDGRGSRASASAARPAWWSACCADGSERRAAAAARAREPAEDDDLLTGPDLAPEPRRRPAGHPRLTHGRRQQPRDGLALLELEQVLHRVVQRADLDDLQPAGRGLAHVGAVAGRGQEHRRALVAGRDHLQLDAADRADLAVGVDRPGAGDEPAAGEVARCRPCR